MEKLKNILSSFIPYPLHMDMLTKKKLFFLLLNILEIMKKENFLEAYYLENMLQQDFPGTQYLKIKPYVQFVIDNAEVISCYIALNQISDVFEEVLSNE